MKVDLNGKRALVCGSTQGIGKACAVELARAGASVTLIARDKEKLNETLVILEKNANQTHRYIVADFADPKTLEIALSGHLKQYPECHILINNSGGPAPGPASEANVDEYTKAFQQHLICNQVLVKECIPLMKKDNYGRILNIISTSVKAPIPGLGVSNTIRGAVANWGKTLSMELGPFGITVNNLLPGFTDTQRLRSLITGRAKNQELTEDAVAAEMEASVPLKRFARPEEFAYLVVFLSSPYASYISGTNIPVDGGRTPCG